MPKALCGYMAAADIALNLSPSTSKVFMRVHEDYWISINVLEVFGEVKTLSCGCKVNCEVVLQSGFGGLQCKVS